MRAMPPVCVEYPRIVAAQAEHSIHFNAPVLLANALAAFALNLVGAQHTRGWRAHAGGSCVGPKTLLCVCLCYACRLMSVVQQMCS